MDKDTHPAPAPWRPPVEWATVAVAVAVYAAYALVTWHHDALPWWVEVALGGAVLAWHGSLQHEVIHGHPTASRRVNEWLVAPNLWLWMPYRRYRDLHLAHHRCATLTDPLEDPESYYVERRRWGGAGPAARALLAFNQTLLGRVTVGPALGAFTFWRAEWRAIRAGDRAVRRAWWWYLPGAALVAVWAFGICGIPVAEYALLYVYPSISLTMVRSFAEHRPDADPARRTTVTEGGLPWSLLFLNNQLHVAHHENPTLPWYRLPSRWRAIRREWVEGRGITVHRGYRDVARRYLLTPRASPVHPDR